MFDQHDFVTLTRGPIDSSEYDYADATTAPVPLPASYTCPDSSLPPGSGGQVCHGIGSQAYTDNTLTFHIAAAVTPVFTDWPAAITPGTTLADFTPPPDYMTVQLDWGDFDFTSYNNGCYVDPVTSQPLGCGDTILNQPGFFLDTGDYALDLRPDGDVTWFRTGTEHDPDGTSGLHEFRATEDTGDPAQWPTINEAPYAATSTANIPGHSAFVKIPDAMPPAYTGDPGNDASRYLIPWGALDTLTVSWPDLDFGELAGTLQVRVALFWDLTLTAGLLMLVV